MVELTTAERLSQNLEVEPWKLKKYKVQKVMVGAPVTLFMLVLTIWALFGADIQAMSAPKSADGGYEAVAIVLFVIFMLELLINSVTQDKYFLSFFWFLDLVAALSMLLDVEVVRTALMGDTDQDLTVARAGRAARAGTRAGRLLKMTRLLRVIKLFRTVKKDRSADTQSEERADGLGPKVSELTTNKVVIGVLLMLVIFPYLSVPIIDNGPALGLKGLQSTFDPLGCAGAACNETELALQPELFRTTLADFEAKYGERLLHLMVGGKDVVAEDTAAIALRRPGTEYHWETVGGVLAEENKARLDDKEDSETQAFLSLMTTLLVVVVLGAGSFQFGADANKFSSRISTPMKALCADMQMVANLEYKPMTHNMSGIQEVRDIQESFMRMKGGLETFAKYVPLAVVRQITKGGREAVLGIEDKQMSFFFCDIQGFTTVCEAMNSRPHDLLAFLGEFFAEMAAIVEDTGGTLIEYIGDAILATWNDRPEAPVEDHAFAAASASYRMRVRLEELHPIWQKKFYHGKGAPPIYLRTGVHTGNSWVGYIGSLSRMKYGLLGDHVEVAMTLEEINKTYGTFTLVSEGNYNASKRIQETFVVRPVDVRRNEPLSICVFLFAVPEAVLRWYNR